MGSLGASGSGGLWGMRPFHGNTQPEKWNKESKPSSNSSRDAAGKSAAGVGAAPYSFPLKQSATAASLVLAGDTIAQVHQKWVKHKDSVTSPQDFKDIAMSVLCGHDWIRALRMTSYGLLLYGPGSYAWYQYLDHSMPRKNVTNLITKVLLNQIVLGPTVIGVVFAWNNLWLGKLADLPNKYRKHALPTLFYGFRFWIPVSVLNFWAIPLQARVGFMATASVFWNFYLSSTITTS